MARATSYGCRCAIAASQQSPTSLRQPGRPRSALSEGACLGAARCQTVAMDATTFLTQYVPGYAALEQPERDAISHFTLLWSAMEGRVLQTNANPTSLVETAKVMARAGQVNLSAYQRSLAHFRERYFIDGGFTDHFDQLLFRPRDRRALVEAVLSGNDNDSASVVAALLLIVYRLRNNLFHGAKWAYGIKGQQANFTFGAEVLMRVLEVHGVP